MADSKTIVLFPEAAFGPALNCVGIAQALRRLGHNPVFICDRGFKGVFAKYGFEENLVDMSGGMSEEELAAHLARIKPDLVCVDNVILFPATKRAGVPWVRIISCSENEIPDPDIPPHLSGCHENDKAGFEAFDKEFLKLVKPTHDRYNEFLTKVGHERYPLGQF